MLVTKIGQIEKEHIDIPANENQNIEIESLQTYIGNGVIELTLLGISLILGGLLTIARNKVKELMAKIEEEKDETNVISKVKDLISKKENEDNKKGYIEIKEQNEIYGYLGVIKEQTKCERVYIIELHNGQVNKISNLYATFTLTYELKDTNLLSKRQELKQVPVTLIAKEILDLEEKDNIVISSKNRESLLFLDEHYEVSYLFKLKNEYNMLFGILVLDFSSNQSYVEIEDAETVMFESFEKQVSRNIDLEEIKRKVKKIEKIFKREISGQ